MTAIVVVGAGAAGLAAAISAARRGADVILVERSSRLGGTVTRSLIHTLGGLFDSEGEPLNDGLPVELVDRLLRADSDTRPRKIGRTWTLSVDPQVYEDVVTNWLREFPNLAVVLDTPIDAVETKDGRVMSLGSKSTSVSFREPRAIVDASGTVEVVRRIDPKLVVREPAAAGLVFQIRGVKPGALAFPYGVQIVQRIREACRDGDLPPECHYAWIDVGVRSDEAYLKLFVPDPSPPGVARATAQGNQLFAFLRSVDAFSDAECVRVGEVGIRDGGRAIGQGRLTVDHVRELKKVSEPAGRCCWPIEYWDPSSGVKMEYLRAQDYYEIPLSALKVEGVDVWVVGKCLSADPLAQASARVVGSCWAMGDAVGKVLSEQGQ